jgi:putative lipoprotein
MPTADGQSVHAARFVRLREQRNLREARVQERSRSIIVLVAIGVVFIAGCRRSDESAGRNEAASTSAPAAVPAAPPAPVALPAQAEDDAPPEGVLRAYVWDCDGGLTLRMRNLFREKAISLELHEGARKLPQLPSASGARYGDASVVFWTKGGTATFERKGSPLVNCRENRARSLAADARVRGVEFRGMGNEPGWVLEVGPGNSLVFLMNYGEERHEFHDASVSGDLATGRSYSATHGADGFRATVRKEPCSDDMAGTQFDYSFVVESGTRTYRGCGDSLR